jgi:hypothetical protein
MAQDTSDPTTDAAAGCNRIIIGPPSGPGALERVLEDSWSGAPDLRMLLVEADPARAALLETRFAAQHEVQVIAAAVLEGGTGKVDLVAYNFPGLASIHPPLPVLRQILPGLAETSRKQTDTVDLQTLVQGLEPGPLDLYVNAAGSEMAILDAAAAAGLLRDVVRLRLRCGAEPMFEGAQGRDALLARCTEHGLKLSHEDTEDPDFPELFFDVDLTARARDAARAQAAQLEVALSEAQTDLKAANEKIVGLEAALSEARDETKVAQTATNEIRETLHKCNGELEARDKVMAEARATFEAELAEEQKNTRQLRETLNTRNGELETLRKQAAAKTDAPPKTDPTAEQELARSKADLAVALRMQMLAQSDLRDLQARFREVEQARAAQQSLLEKLTPRLRQAAHELQHMQMIEAEAEQAEALTPPAARSTRKTTAKKAATKASGKAAKTTSKRPPRTPKASTS